MMEEDNSLELVECVIDAFNNVRDNVERFEVVFPIETFKNIAEKDYKTTTIILKILGFQTLLGYYYTASGYRMPLFWDCSKKPKADAIKEMKMKIAFLHNLCDAFCDVGSHLITIEK